VLPQESYSYDPVGNRLTKTDTGGTISYSYDANDRLLTAGGSSFNYDANGNRRYVEVHGHPILDAQGNVALVIEYSLDITDRKMMEDAAV
jgi:YD repeat-containing protein